MIEAPTEPAHPTSASRSPSPPKEHVLRQPYSLKASELVLKSKPKAPAIKAQSRTPSPPQRSQGTATKSRSRKEVFGARPPLGTRVVAAAETDSPIIVTPPAALAPGEALSEDGAAVQGGREQLPEPQGGVEQRPSGVLTPTHYSLGGPRGQRKLPSGRLSTVGRFTKAGNTQRASLIREMDQAHSGFSTAPGRGPIGEMSQPRPGSAMAMYWQALYRSPAPPKESLPGMNHTQSSSPNNNNGGGSRSRAGADMSGAGPGGGGAAAQAKEGEPEPRIPNPMTPQIWEEMLRSRLVAPLGWSPRPGQECSVPVRLARSTGQISGGSRPSSGGGGAGPVAPSRKALEKNYREEFREDRRRTARVYANPQSAGGPPVILYAPAPGTQSARATPSPFPGAEQVPRGGSAPAALLGGSCGEGVGCSLLLEEELESDGKYAASPPADWDTNRPWEHQRPSSQAGDFNGTVGYSSAAGAGGRPGTPGTSGAASVGKSGGQAAPPRPEGGAEGACGGGGEKGGPRAEDFDVDVEFGQGDLPKGDVYVRVISGDRARGAASSGMMTNPARLTGTAGCSIQAINMTTLSAPESTPLAGTVRPPRLARGPRGGAMKTSFGQYHG